MSIPPSIRVGPYDYAVKRTEKVDDANSYGSLDFENHTITLRHKYKSAHMEADTVLHEVLHAAWFTSNLKAKDDEERIVSGLATALTQVMRDNPKLFQALARMVKAKR